MDNKLIKQFVFGAVGGAAGTLVLGQLRGLISRFQSQHDRWIERELVREEPTEGLVRRVAEDVLGTEVSPKRRHQLGQAVHWGYGIIWGGVYGVLRHRLPATSKAAGLPFGAGLTLFGDALLLPFFNLTPSPMEFPLSCQARDLAARCAYAATVEGVCTTLNAVDRKIGSRHHPHLTRPELREAS